jgi:hypothetical protein
MKKTTVHYVDNQKFLAELKAYRVAAAKAKKLKQEAPQVSEYLGECFLKIATHLSYRPNFVNYTFREDMISDGVENCLVYMNNFDPAKSSNPFGYFTQIVFFAFVRRIMREKKHTYIKYRLINQAIISGATQFNPVESPNIPVEGSNILNFDNVKEFINNFESYAASRRERRKTAKASKVARV